MSKPNSFVIQKRSRKKSRAGDIFVFQLDYIPEYFFGMVISDCPTYFPGSAPEEEFRLIYIYKHTSPDKNQIPILHSEDLLVEPIIIARQAWSYGYFENVAHHDIVQSDYCKASYWIHAGKDFYTVDWSNNLWTKTKYPGVGWTSVTGVASAAGIESRICQELNIISPVELS